MRDNDENTQKRFKRHFIDRFGFTSNDDDASTGDDVVLLDPSTLCNACEGIETHSIFM